MRCELTFGMYQGTSSSLISPSRVRREGRNWHLTATKDVARLPWLRRACPSATLDKKGVFSCSADYIRCPISGANKKAQHFSTSDLRLLPAATRNTLRPSPAD